ncbi:MAG: hypothetical protein DRR19_33280 [Candidatus Parabeggiatoa sp. nov. 1]|nr:MAG: hypothetical protein DRR19_33280 [Gammaproteobacteria bacterium]
MFGFYSYSISRLRKIQIQFEFQGRCPNAIKLSTNTFYCRVGNVFWLPTCPETVGKKNTLPTLQKTLKKP